MKTTTAPGRLAQPHELCEGLWSEVTRLHNLSDTALADIARQKVERAAFLASDDGKDFIAALDERDAAEQVLREQKEEPLPNKLEHRAAIRTLNVELSEISSRITDLGWRGVDPKQRGEIEARIRGAGQSAQAGEDAGVAAECRVAVPPSVATTPTRGGVVHKLVTRRDTLAPAIDRATELATDPEDPHAVWNRFVALAKALPPTPPLTGYRHGLVSHAEGNISKASFIKRLKRRADKHR